MRLTLLKKVDYTVILLFISYIYLVIFSKFKNIKNDKYFMYLNLLFFLLTIIIIYFSFYITISGTKKNAVKNVNMYIKSKRKEYTEKYDPRTTDNIEYLVPRNLSHISIYYINLDKSTDRNIAMLKEFEKYGLISFKRVRAVDANKLLKNKEDITYTDESRNTTMKELATTLSHMKAIKQAYTDGNSLAIILEDDMTLVLVPFWKKTILEIIDTLPKDWTILNMSHLNCSVDGENLTSHSEKMCFSAGAYLINIKGMEKIMKYIDSSGDVDNYKIMPKKKSLFLADGSADIYIYSLLEGVYYYHTPLFFERPGKSTIHSSHEVQNLLKTVARISYTD